MKPDQKIFTNILHNIKESIGETNFAFIFTSIELVSLQDKKLVFGVPAEMFKQTIDKEYLSLIKEIAYNKAQITDVEIIVSDQKNAVEFFVTEKSSNTNTTKPSQKTQLIQLKTKNLDNRISNSFTFKNFIVGSSNSFAHSVATVIAKNPGEAHNPCLIYGNVGLGKTHLLHAIGNDVRNRMPTLKVLYYPSEDFLNEFLLAIQNNKSRDFKNRIRSADVLLLDDIQFFTGKPALQEEFYHSFNTLMSEQKQMVFTSDRPVYQIRDLEERLQSRFRSNMIVDLQAPSPEMAMSILKNTLTKNNKPNISTEILNVVVERLRYNIRDMLGVISRIDGYEKLTGNKVNANMVRQWTAEYIPRKNSQRKTTSEKIVATTASLYNITLSDLKSKKRNRRITRIRHIASYLLRDLTNNSLTEIGNIFNISHVSVSNAITQIEKEIDVDPLFAEEIEEIKIQIHQKEE